MFNTLFFNSTRYNLPKIELISESKVYLAGTTSVLAVGNYIVKSDYAIISSMGRSSALAIRTKHGDALFAAEADVDALAIRIVNRGALIQSEAELEALAIRARDAILTIITESTNSAVASKQTLRVVDSYLTEVVCSSSRVGSGDRVVQSWIDSVITKLKLPEIHPTLDLAERLTVLEVEEPVARKGDTVRLKADFSTFDGAHADPDNIVLRIYDKRHLQVGETIQIGSEYRQSAGVYWYDYTIPLTTAADLFFEFSGTLEGKPVFGRGEIAVSWV